MASKGSDAMKCPQCQHENPYGAKFCMECGAKLENVCPECGAKLPLEAKFCMECGAKIAESEPAPTGTTIPSLEDVHARLQRSMPESLASQMRAVADMEGENRIISILFADVSGSVAVTENIPPEDAAELISECLKAMVDAILKYEGSINRFLGDSVLAFFGTPETHENDPERAVLAALEMQEAVNKLELDITIGINTGVVYVGAIGPDSHSEFTAMGTAVNLAARLEKEADPGQILVGQATYRLTRRAFEYAAPQIMNIRGISEPVNVYRVIKPLSRPEKIRGIEGLRAEMIGREREFSDLRDSVNELLSGNGQIVSIIGEAGVGKSRLVSELKEHISDKKMKWLEGRCVSIGESIGYWLFIDMLRGYLDFAEDETPETLREKIVNRMKALFPQRWEEIVPYLANLLSVRGGEWGDTIKNLSPEQIKQQTSFVLRDVILTLSQQKPLLLIFEDLHWADSLSLDMVNLLMDTLSLAPIMLLCVHRPYKEHRSWHISAQASAKCLDRYRELALRPMNPQESRRLVGALLDIDNLPEPVRESILTKAEGNPFFVEEVIRSLIESGVVYQDGDQWVAKAEIGDITIPDSIQSVIMSRIDRLEDEARYVLQSASVIGRLFRHRLLGYITRQEQRLDEYLWKLEERDLVYEERAIPELEYSFRHVLTQETAYNTILSRRRKEFHHKVAEGYESLYSSRLEEYYEELAYHYSRSDDNQKALDYLVKAGDKSRESFANEEAVAYYNQALGLIDDSEATHAPLLGHIYQSLGEIYFPLTKHEEALECCRKALEYTTNKRARAGIYGTMGWIYERESKFNLALEHLNSGIVELGDDTECPEMARMCCSLAWVTRWEGNLVKSIELAQRGLKIVERTAYYLEIEQLCVCLLSIYSNPVFRLNDINKAFEYARRSVEATRESGNSYLIACSTFWLGWVHTQNCEDDIAIRLMGEAVEIYRKIGRIYDIGQAYYWLIAIYMKKGDWDAAIEYLKFFLEVPSHPWYQYTISRLAWIYLQRGHAEKAIEVCKKALNAGVYTALGIMEEAFAEMGKRRAFISYCRKLREQKREAAQDLKFTQWYLEPKPLSGHFTRTAFKDEFDQPFLKAEWEWMNPSGDSSYCFSADANGLEVRAASWSNLHHQANFDAPRLLQEISGDFAAEVKMKAALGDLPSVGGLLVWEDRENYIRLERGIHGKDVRFERGMPGKYEIGLSASIDSAYNHFGRGMLASDTLYLRLERIDDRLSAYCSSDGKNWLTCGEVDFPAEDSIQVGIHAIGGVGFPGGHVDTATRFDYFRLLRKASQAL